MKSTNSQMTLVIDGGNEYKVTGLRARKVRRRILAGREDGWSWCQRRPEIESLTACRLDLHQWTTLSSASQLTVRLGWPHYRWEAPDKIINDAAMQALGGLWFGLGAAMVADGVLQPIDLGTSTKNSTRITHGLGKKWRSTAEVIQKTQRGAGGRPSYLVAETARAKKLPLDWVAKCRCLPRWLSNGIRIVLEQPCVRSLDWLTCRCGFR